MSIINSENRSNILVSGIIVLYLSVNNIGKIYYHNNLGVSHLIVVQDNSKKVHITVNQQ